MIDISGYGIMRDDYVSSIPEFEPVLQEEDDVIWKIIKREKINALKSLARNIKSKYIKQDQSKPPIIASKSYSIRHSLFTKKYKDDKNQSYDDIYTMYICNSNIESNTYPIRNFDLLDMSTKNNLKEGQIYYDKLILNSISDKLLQYKSIGPLFNISPQRIPVVTKSIPIDIDSKPITISYQENETNPRIILMYLNSHDIVNNFESYMHVIKCIFRIQKHFRTIQFNKKMYDVYIPDMVIRFTYNINLKDLSNAFIEYRISNGTKNKHYSIGELTSLNVSTILDEDFKYCMLYSFYNNNITKGIEDIYMFISESLSKLQSYVIMPWPFGNVYSGGNVCGTFNNISNWSLMLDSIINNDYNINIFNLIHGICINFLESPFTSDLARCPFIIKKDMIDYINTKKSMIKENNKHKFNLYINSIRKELKDIEKKHRRSNSE